MKVLYCIVLILLISCSSVIKTNNDKIYNSTYIGEDYHNTITFYNDSLFTFFPPSGSVSYEPYRIDTLGFGNWRQDENLIVLNSKYVSTYKVEVKESFTGSNDSLYIVINNKIDGIYFVDEVLRPYCNYAADINTKTGKRIFSDGFSNKFASFVNEPINDLYIDIIPNLLIYPTQITRNEFHTYPYKVINPDSNTFTIRYLILIRNTLLTRFLRGSILKL